MCKLYQRDHSRAEELFIHPPPSSLHPSHSLTQDGGRSLVVLIQSGCRLGRQDLLEVRDQRHVDQLDHALRRTGGSYINTRAGGGYVTQELRHTNRMQTEEILCVYYTLGFQRGEKVFLGGSMVIY